MVEIKAGLEMDILVSAAIAEDHEVYSVQSYSTDLNAAFTAAEAVGLFVKSVHMVMVNNGEWSIHRLSRQTPDSLSFEPLGVASTPALAICAAILKLKGGRS